MKLETIIVRKGRTWVPRGGDRYKPFRAEVELEATLDPEDLPCEALATLRKAAGSELKRVMEEMETE